MQFIDMFPTPLMVSTEMTLRDEVLPIAEEYIYSHGKPFSNNENYISTYGINSASFAQSNDTRLNGLTNTITKYAHEYFETHCIDSKQNWNFSVYYLFNRMTGGGEHSLHSHPWSMLSGCFYLKVPNGAPPIIFQDPRDYHKFIHYPIRFGETREKYKLLSEYVIHPTDGMLLMWPSWLEHQVPKSQVDDERIVVAFNIETK